MKQKRPERVVERRRALVELNLIGETKTRAASLKRRGCALLGSSALLAATVAAATAAFLGLH
jgi:hypothetical protein